MISIKNKVDCCGCTACKNICPHGAITMKEDEEGFLYPEIDQENCVQCGMCDQVCPIIKRREKREEISLGYIVNNKEKEIRLQSTSGGAFTAIAKYVLNNNGIVFGACFNEKFEVNHIGIKDIDKLEAFRGSKYVQSNLKDTFKEVKEYLDKEKLVCFSGTPCQIEGLKKYLKKDFENLVTVDVVCRAVPSPKLYRKYLNYIRKYKLNEENITKVSFRDKEKYGYKYTMMKVEGETKKYFCGVETDPYLRAFFHNVSDRPSCYNCKFRDKNRVSDFTIWDCFITEEFAKEMDDNIGTTRMIIHTNKGKDIFENIKEDFVYKEVEIERLTADVEELRKSVTPNQIRANFFRDMNQLEERELFNKYFPDTIRVRIERITRKILVKFPIYKAVKKKLKKIIKKN